MTAIFGTRKKPRFWGYMIITTAISLSYAYLLQNVIKTQDFWLSWFELTGIILISNAAWWWLSRG